MDEAARVLERLQRIRQLDRAEASPTLLLAELRQLVGEAEAWARLEGDDRAGCAAAELASAVMSGEEARLGTMAVPERSVR